MTSPHEVLNLRTEDFPMPETVTITFSLQTNKVGSFCTTTIEVPTAEWAEMSEVERGSYAKEMFWDEALSRLGSWDWKASDESEG
ncbi:MAG TPA: hypothetical protein VGW74_09365 [Propionibacteriaceae bacterium]|nr:hypothetical protein [Propionibacteriaceae bacterium]